MTGPDVVFDIAPAASPVLVIDMRGPRGPAGPASAAEGLARVATVALSGHRVVVDVSGVGARYPDLTAAADAELVLGITTGASAADDSLVVQAAGDLVEPSWAWATGPVFCGVAGQLTQSPPLDAAWLRQVGVAVAPDRLLVQLRPPIILA